MKILYIGDIFGELGLNYLKENLQNIRQEYKVNMIFVNGENVSGGKGLNFQHYQDLMKLGVSAITMGNHTFSNKEIREYINESKVIRPANLNTDLGKGYQTIKYNDKTITVINLLGRIYMNNMCLDCPFQTLDKILETVKSDYYIVDIHAEATSEKIALALDFDGKVDAVVGTHTHVSTADNRVLPNGTLYISDIGMTGPLNGVIGDNAQTIIKRFRTGIYEPAKTETGEVQFNAVLLDLNDNKNSITRINLIK